MIEMFAVITKKPLNAPKRSGNYSKNAPSLCM